MMGGPLGWVQIFSWNFGHMRNLLPSTICGRDRSMPKLWAILGLYDQIFKLCRNHDCPCLNLMNFVSCCCYNFLSVPCVRHTDHDGRWQNVLHLSRGVHLCSLELVLGYRQLVFVHPTVDLSCKRLTSCTNCSRLLEISIKVLISVSLHFPYFLEEFGF